MTENNIETIELDGCRFYKIFGEYYPSVTTILSEKKNHYLEKWKQKLSPDQIFAILSYTAIRGEVIHYLALKEYESETITQGTAPNEAIDIVNENDQMLSEIWKAVDLFHEFQSQYSLEPIALEKVVWNDRFRYAGRVDFQGYLVDETNGRKTPILMDIKTSKKIYPESASLQLSAYNHCLDNFAEKIFILLLHPSQTVVENIIIGAPNAFWRFEAVEDSFSEFTYYQTMFRPKARQILRKHGLSY